MINAVTSFFGPPVNIHGCFYHLIQSTWRKIQSFDLVQRYHGEDVKLFCSMVDGMALLPEDGVAEGMAILCENIQDGLESLLQYFGGTYVSGTYQQIQLPLCSDGTLHLLRMRCKTRPTSQLLQNGLHTYCTYLCNGLKSVPETLRGIVW